MDSKTRSIIIGAIALLAISSILFLAVFLGRTSRNNSSLSRGSNSLSNLPVIAPSASPAPEVLGTNRNIEQPGTTKTYSGSGFNLQYPKSWGLVTCNNSQNFEFDPTNAGDAPAITCDRAVKPVTVLLVDRLSCPGNVVNLGGNTVIKSRAVENNGDINYRWCLTSSGKNFDITHRVSATGSPSSGKEDFSEAVEKIIASLKVSPRGS